MNTGVVGFKRPRGPLIRDNSLQSTISSCSGSCYFLVILFAQSNLLSSGSGMTSKPSRVPQFPSFSGSAYNSKSLSGSKGISCSMFLSSCWTRLRRHLSLNLLHAVELVTNGFFLDRLIFHPFIVQPHLDLAYKTHRGIEPRLSGSNPDVITSIRMGRKVLCYTHST